MTTCGVSHPEHDLSCEIEAAADSPAHPADHSAWSREHREMLVWVNDQWVAPVKPDIVKGRRGAGEVYLKGLGDLVPPKQTSVSAEAHARHTDPETSHAAARSVGDLTEAQEMVLGLLRHAPEPLCDEQIHEALLLSGHVMTTSGARTRRSELVDAGLVEDSGLRAKTEAGRDTICWRAI